MKTTQPKGLIILRHSILDKITKSQVQQKVEENYGKLIYKDIAIEPVTDIPISHKEIKDINWGLVALKQQEIYNKQIKPIIQKHPDYEVVYFGATPIPLAVHLGYLIGTWKKVSVYLKHHDTKEWYKDRLLKEENEFIETKPKIVTNGFPQEEYFTKDDVLIRISTSYNINLKEVDDSIVSNLVKKIYIGIENLCRDLPNAKDAERVAVSFSDALKSITDNLKEIDTIHLIPGVPVGLAFLLGTKISANITHPIQTYQYHQDARYKYEPVLKINSSLDTYKPLMEEELVNSRKIQTDFQTDVWDKIQAFINDETATKKKSKLKDWCEYIFDKSKHWKPFIISRWKDLPFLSSTPLLDTSFILDDEVVAFQFFEDKNSWGIGNRLINGVFQKSNGDKSIVHRSMRMLLFHEGMHYWKHGLNDATANGIGRFPKILEEADYQADVWAMLYEYRYSKLYHADEVKPINIFFRDLVKIALQTMWSFDDEGTELNLLQIRRVNRYLIWYWQLLRLEDKRTKSIQDIAQIFSETPLIELKGLLPKTEGQRVYYRLDKFEVSDLEVGLLWKNKIIRTGNLGHFRIEYLIDRFRKRDHNGIKSVLRGLYKMVSAG